jgi:MerR family copper efflux transcriptional regulator
MGKVKEDHEPRPVRPVTIGRAAAAAGLSPKAVRLYEARGLLPMAARTAAGYRLYTDTDIARMRFIAAARELGLHIDQISEILATAHDGQPPCATTRAILDQRISEIDEVINRLTDLRSTLAAARNTNPARADEPVICPVIEGHTHRMSPPT